MSLSHLCPVERAVRLPRDAVPIWATDAGLKVQRPDQSGSAPAYTLPPIYPEWLGDRKFTHDHNVRFAYVAGEMARGIATPEMVIAAAEAGLLGFYGSAGLQVDEIRRELTRIKSALESQGLSWGANLIHTPQQPGYEAAIVDLFLEKGVRRVSASAFMRLSAEIVRYTAVGLSLDADGHVKRSNHVFAKVSRAEVGRQFMAPAPAEILDKLVADGRISEQQEKLAARVPVAAEITAEADSGGHTDNRPASVVFSSLVEARARTAQQHGIDPDGIRIGLAGGIATPHSVAAAYQMGAAYVLTGSINQSAEESGLSEIGRRALAKAGPADVMMAPAADMFEQGVKVQVLKRGTLFAMRGERLYALYRAGASFEAMDEKQRQWLEKILGESFAAAWEATRDFLEKTNPETVQQAEKNANQKFALVCRRYLFMGAQWAREGDEARQADFQIWCGPAMGAFNDWVAGTYLEPIEARNIRQIAWNLLEGAATLARASQLRAAGVAVAPHLFSFKPRPFE